MPGSNDTLNRQSRNHWKELRGLCRRDRKTEARVNTRNSATRHSPQPSDLCADNMATGMDSTAPSFLAILGGL